MGIDDDRDGEGYHFYGSAIDEETGPTRSYRKKVKDVASTRQVPLHMQEVTDSDGRKRFHGAFTGGFSAGYYNTVGSKEGWAPQQFKSSRGDRAAVQQRVEDYLDEDELQESRKATIGTKVRQNTGVDFNIFFSLSFSFNLGDDVCRLLLLGAMLASLGLRRTIQKLT